MGPLGRKPFSQTPPQTRAPGQIRMRADGLVERRSLGMMDFTTITSTYSYEW